MKNKDSDKDPFDWGMYYRGDKKYYWIAIIIFALIEIILNISIFFR